MSEKYKNKKMILNWTDLQVEGANNSIENKNAIKLNILEDTLMSYVGNLDNYAQEYLIMKFNDIINKNLFNLLKGKKENSFGYCFLLKKFMFFAGSKFDDCLDKI